MLAGSHAKAIELATACKGVIREFTDIEIQHGDLDLAVDKFMHNLKKVAAEKKAALIKTYVQNSIGVDHSEFVKLPTDQYLDVWHSIRNITLGADILISSVKHEPVIVRLDRWGEPHWENNYGVIGNGAEIARAMLCLQLWTASVQHGASSFTRAMVPIEECVFRLAEAHFAAHKTNPSSVGESIILRVLGSNYRANVNPSFLEMCTIRYAASIAFPQSHLLMIYCVDSSHARPEPSRIMLQMCYRMGVFRQAVGRSRRIHSGNLFLSVWNNDTA